MHKVLRDKARLYFLIKDKQQEKESEEASQLVYEMYCKERGLAESDKKWWGFSLLNIKVIKLIFNRAYRVSGQDPSKACELYNEILKALDELMPSHAQMSYYHAKMYLEIAKSYSQRLLRAESLEAVKKAENILETVYGKDHALYLDYLFTMTQMSFDIEFEKEEV